MLSLHFTVEKICSINNFLIDFLDFFSGFAVTLFIILNEGFLNFIFNFFFHFFAAGFINEQ